ncbi:MAG: helix-turn-helix domain-containing protein [Treponema sp.]|jgi:transcriptional regulator with XRE-family HTH domain|nr:helix-turn-helix domain-containing protein [Treponema sp.]
MKKNSGKGKFLKILVSLNIKRFRANTGLSQEDLAEKAEISVPYLGAIERGEKWPSPDTFAGIAQGLGVEPFDLMRPEDASSQEVNKIITKLIADITTLVNSSLKMMNTIIWKNNSSKK